MQQTLGAFGQDDLRKILASGRLVAGNNFRPDHVGPASVDLTVDGIEMYRIERLFRPRAQTGEKVRNILPHMGASPIKLGDELMPGYEYLMRASVSANFPPGMYGYANAKSTSGRTFLLVRTIADESGWFDGVDKRNDGYTGEIWLAIQPLIFPIILTEKECYNQIRIFSGDTRFSEVDLRDTLEEHDLLFRWDQSPYTQKELSLFSNDGSVFMTLHAPGKKHVGYRAKKSKRSLDLTARGLDPREYFEPVFARESVPGDPDSGFVELRAGDYYLLSTNEMLKVPEHLCAELRALDPRLGLFFSHFAGFFDPGFFGTATLEVLAPHDMVLRHKDPVARFVFEKMRSATISYANAGNYQGQVDTRLPKQFLPWE